MLPSALPFSRSLRSLRLDGYRAALWAGAAAAVLLFLWGGWVRLAEVPLYEASAAARTVADRAAHPIVSEVSGRVLTVHVVLGQEVAEGDLLLELDADEPRLALAEGRAREGASRAELSKLEAQLAAGEQALAAARDAAAHSLAEAAARKRELELTEVLARDELARLERLASLGGVSELELARARTEAERGAAALETHARGEERAERERARSAADREADLAALARQRSRLEGELERGVHELARLEAEIARRSLRAPAAGEVAELTPLTRGSWVGAGATLATVVAPGALAVEADFPAAAAVGRIRPGQRGRLRLDGFPWARFGSVPVEVARVGAEARDGLVRVELHLDAGETAVPLGHGLVGTVEVEVERVSPFELLLRSAGRRAPAAVQAEPR